MFHASLLLGLFFLLNSCKILARIMYYLLRLCKLSCKNLAMNLFSSTRDVTNVLIARMYKGLYVLYLNFRISTRFMSYVMQELLSI